MEKFRFEANINKIFKLNLLFIHLLLIANCIVLYMNWMRIGSYKFRTLFNFDYELNIPTFYSAISLLFSSLILFIISKMIKNKSFEIYYWKFLSLLFLFLSIDEFSQIHEWFGTHSANQDAGPWYFYYLPFVSFICFVYLNF